MQVTEPGSASALAERRDAILARIANASARSGRDARAVDIVAVTKTIDAATIRLAYEAGFRSFGENRVQEREAKARELAAADGPVAGDAARLGAWHLIGPLQSNKARKAIELFDCIQSVDSLELARRLDRIAAEVRPGRALPVLVQVNVDADPAKAGYEPATLERELGGLLDLANLRVDGLMTVGRQVDAADDARPTFVALRQLSERLRTRDPRLGPALSMGMTDDYPIAVEEGATIVRIGRAIFGPRPAAR